MPAGISVELAKVSAVAAAMEVVIGLLIVTLTPGLIAVIVEVAGTFVPVTVCPITRPVVLATGMICVPVPLAVAPLARFTAPAPSTDMPG